MLDEVELVMTEPLISKPEWWHQRTTTERYLIVVSGAAVCVLIGMSITLAIMAGKNKNESGSHICISPSCIKTASAVLKSMDVNVNPCDDFYHFACGSYIRETMIPDDKSEVSQFYHVDDHLQKQLRTIISEPAKEKDARPYVLAKDLYAACMNKSAIEQRGLEPMKLLLKDLGGWPLLEGNVQNGSNFSWKDMVYKLREYGFSVHYFITLFVDLDYKNSTLRRIYLDEATLGLSREYMVKGINDEIVKQYHQYQLDIAVLMGADRKKAARELQECLEFEIKLAEISLPREQHRNITELYNLVTVDNLQKSYPSIQWLEYINNILPASVKIDNNEEIVILVPSFIKQLEDLLNNTSDRVLANYAMSRVMMDSVSYLTDDLRSKHLKFETILTGITEREPRWKECIDIVTRQLPLAAASLYVQKYFKKEIKHDTLEMVQDIKNEFYKILESVDWMDEETRKQGLEKAHAMAEHIAYPDELLEVAKLEEFYKSLDVSKDLYLESILNLTTFETDYLYGKLKQKVNKTDWIIYGAAAVVNAYYDPFVNSIEIPAGILQGQFFNSERPHYMNYGAIGYVIGHEITHGFDDEGSQLDKDGDLVDWWGAESKEKYLKKAQCIIEQYGNYTDRDTGLKLHGINTQGENIADNGGIKVAYRAYVAWTSRHGEEPYLPGLEFSPRQLFWISAAQTWCSKSTLEGRRQQIMTDDHSPEEFRILGPLSNSEEFSSDFNCPKGSNMNPVKKCSVW